MKNDIESSAIQLAKAQDFSRISSLENYDGMLGTLSEDDPKVRSFITNESPRFKVEFYRLDVDTGPKNIKNTRSRETADGYYPFFKWWLDTNSCS